MQKKIRIETQEQIRRIYNSIRPEITVRLKEFNRVWENGKEKDIFRELVFCLLTPQSKAESAWEAVKGLEKNGLLLKGDAPAIANWLRIIRFRFNKARYILEAREKFAPGGKPRIMAKIKSFKNAFGAREWIVKNVKGLGYKEAGHFLRNIGMGGNLAILDRHILKNLRLLGIIKDAPKSLPRKIYFEIERNMVEFSRNVAIPMPYLDFVLWYKEAGKVFK